MVRISEEHSFDGNKVVRLEGKVVGLAVGQVQSFCQETLAEGVTLTINMAEVSFLDRDGVSLFRDLMLQGVRLLNCSPFLNELLTPAIRP